eukprot:c48124_g1_i1.p2 GENE.c48124_g1_i1~~c48124_g1_i1.p2  ORF type:complete len:102 (-),score=8.14 c48124_g1_i1:20-325(-)
MSSSGFNASLASSTFLARSPPQLKSLNLSDLQDRFAEMSEEEFGDHVNSEHKIKIVGTRKNKKNSLFICRIGNQSWISFYHPFFFLGTYFLILLHLSDSPE